MSTQIITIQSELENLEKRFWNNVNDPTTYEELMADNGIFVGQSIGIVDKASAIKMSKDAGTWTGLKMTNVQSMQICPHCASIVYEAEATKVGTTEPYKVRVSSIYSKSDGKWKLAMTHHIDPPKTEQSN